MTKFAFVFPGQGSQAVGMLNGFADNEVVKQTVAEASDALQFDLAKLIAEGPKEDLDLTTNTQPVMLTAAVAFYRAWIAAGGRAPAVVAGHSLGEYSALVAAGVVAFKDAVPLVRFRAKAMQEAVPVGQGGMAAILGLSNDDLRAACVEVLHDTGDAVMNSKFLSAVLAAGLIAGVSGMASAEGMKKNDSMHKSDTMMKKDKPGTTTPRTTGSSGTSKPTASPQTTPAQPMGKGSAAETPKK